MTDICLSANMLINRQAKKLEHDKGEKKPVIKHAHIHLCMYTNSQNQFRPGFIGMTLQVLEVIIYSVRHKYSDSYLPLLYFQLSYNYI